MSEPRFYAEREAKLVSLAEARFDPNLTARERNILSNSVRPGPAPVPKQVAAARGSLLRWIAVDSAASSLIDPNGLQVTSAIIEGDVDLSEMLVPYDFSFIDCAFKGTIALVGASARNINILGCEVLGGIQANFLTCTGELHIEQCHCLKQLNFQSCQIGKGLRFVFSKVDEYEGQSLTFDGAVIGNDLRLYGLQCARRIQAIDAHIGGSINLRGSRLTCKQIALSLDGADIHGDLFLDEYVEDAKHKHPFQCAGDFHAPHMRIGEDIHATNSLFTKKGGTVALSSIEVKNGKVDFSGAQFSSIVDLSAAQIGNDLDFRCAKIFVEDSALDSSGATIAGDVIIREFESAGYVSMHGGTISGSLDCSGAKIGWLLLGQVHIAGNVDATAATFPGKKFAFHFEGVQVSGQMDLTRIKAKNPIFMTQGHVGDALIFDGAKIDAPQGNWAMFVENMEIKGNLALNGFDSNCAVEVASCQIEGNVSCVGARMRFLRMQNTHIEGALSWLGVKNAKMTGLNLRDSSVRLLNDDRNSWPGPGLLNVDGFKYQNLSLCKTPTRDSATNEFPLLPETVSQSANERITWLKLQNSHDVTSSQPWLQLASFFNDRGDAVGGKRVRYMMGRVQGCSQGRLARAASLPYSLIEENPLRISYPIAILWLVGSLVFWRARRLRAMAPTNKDAYALFTQDEPIPGYVPFHPAIYALEVVLPVVKFGQDSAWAPDPAAHSIVERRRWLRAMPGIEYRWLARLRWSLIVLGWLLALILAGAIGSRFKT